MGGSELALTQEQAQRLRQMSPEERRTFHTNRIATSLEAIEALLRDISGKLGSAAVAGEKRSSEEKGGPPA